MEPIIDLPSRRRVTATLALSAAGLLFPLAARSLHHDAGDGIDAWREGVLLLLIDAAGTNGVDATVCDVVVDCRSKGQFFSEAGLGAFLQRRHPLLFSLVVFEKAVHHVLNHTLFGHLPRGLADLRLEGATCLFPLSHHLPTSLLLLNHPFQSLVQRLEVELLLIQNAPLVGIRPGTLQLLYFLPLPFEP